MTDLLLAVLVVALASYRLARAVAIDTISAPARLAAYDRAYPEGGKIAEGDPGEWPWNWAYGLISCPYCCGWWISLVLYLAWDTWGWTHLPIAMVATAGVQAVIQTYVGARES